MRLLCGFYEYWIDDAFAVRHSGLSDVRFRGIYAPHGRICDLQRGKYLQRDLSGFWIRYLLYAMAGDTGDGKIICFKTEIAGSSRRLRQ